MTCVTYTRANHHPISLVSTLRVTLAAVGMTIYIRPNQDRCFVHIWRLYKHCFRSLPRHSCILMFKSGVAHHLALRCLSYAKLHDAIHELCPRPNECPSARLISRALELFRSVSAMVKHYARLVATWTINADFLGPPSYSVLMIFWPREVIQYGQSSMIIYLLSFNMLIPFH